MEVIKIKINETFKIQILPTEEQSIKLREIQNVYLEVCNYISKWIFENEFELKQRTIHDNLYYELRSLFGLSAQITQSAIRSVIGKYKTVEKQLLSNPYKYRDNELNKMCYTKRTLDWLQKPIEFNKQTVMLLRNRDYSVKADNHYSVSVMNGRETMPYLLTDNPHVNKFNDGSWELGGANLIEQNNKWYLAISVSKEFGDFDKETVQHVVGIDRGLRQLVTTYDEKGKTAFYNGQDILKTRRKYKKLRQQLQSKGSKSAKRRLKTIGQRENRWMNDVNHQISKALVEQYGPNTLFVIEDLTNVRFATEKHSKDNRYESVSWAFYDLEQKLAYKAAEKGSLVLKVPAYYTSQRCPKCGTIDKENRQQTEHLFCCKNCSYRSNDDRVAAMNIQYLGTDYISGVKKPHFEKINPATD